MPLFIKSQLQKLAKSLEKSSAQILKNSAETTSDYNQFDIFLSHSSMDADAILGLKNQLENFGYSVYVDWIVDLKMDRQRVTRAIADLIRKRMRQCKCLFYVPSDNAKTSVWMPWELGYFDGLDRVKSMNIDGKVAICPLANEEVYDYKGHEYLGLYPFISADKPQGGEKPILWVNRTQKTYISFKKWLAGHQL